MVKEYVHTETILRCSVKDFFEILYANGDAAAAYHKEVDKDENVQVDAWQGNTRTVHFTMPMQLPAVVAKLIGTSSIPVKEVQQAEMDSEGALHVTSTPIIGVPGGSKFQAIARLTVTNTDVGGSIACQVIARITCTADGPWGLTGMIESIMVEQSASSIKVYLAFATMRCQASPSDQVLEAPGSPRSDATAFEQFFDAHETISRVSSIASSQGISLAVPVDEVVDTVALLQLLETLDGRVGSLASDLAAARSLVSPQGGSRGAPPPHPPLPAPPKPWSTGLAPWMIGFACGAVAASALQIALKRHLRP